MRAILDSLLYLVIGAVAALAVALILRRTGTGRIKTWAAIAVEALRRFAVSAGSLGRAFSPVLVPIAVVVAYATTFYARWVQVVAGALVAWLVWFLWFAEGRIKHDRTAARQLTLGAGRRVAGSASRGISKVTARPGEPSSSSARGSGFETALLLCIALGIVVVFAVVSLWGKPGWVIELGLLIILLAAVLRLGGYLTTWPRAIVVVAVVVIVARVAMFIGLLPYEETLFGLGGARFWVSLAVPAAFLVAAFCWEAIRLHGKDAARPGRWHTLARALGFVLSCGAALALVVGMAFARATTTPGAKPIPQAADPTRRVTLADVGGDESRRLVWTYAPILRLHPDEKFLPSSAGDYVDHLHALGNSCTQTQPSDCTHLRCPECAKESYSTEEALHPNGVVFYARVAQGEDELKAWPADAKEKLATLIQFWIFYDYDRWQAHTVLGDLVQEHDSDWEFVAVGLDPDKQPIFLALSAHCGGQLVPWDSNLAVLPGRVVGDRVHVITPGESGGVPGGIEATHPIVAVGLGSHANYADDSGHRPPDWGSCTHVPSRALDPLVYASNVRDRTAASDDPTKLLQANDIAIVTQSDFPMNVPGTWGEESVSFDHRHWEHRKGPSSPPNQTQSWSNSVRSFLCSSYWTREGQFGSDQFAKACST